MKLIKNYEKALQAIYDHVGFEESWVVYPIDDQTHCFWKLNGMTVCYAKTRKALKAEDGEYYEDGIYTQRFYSKHVYEGVDFTMIFCDSGVDGMRWFRLFDNRKKIAG